MTEVNNVRFVGICKDCGKEIWDEFPYSSYGECKCKVHIEPIKFEEGKEE